MSEEAPLMAARISLSCSCSGSACTRLAATEVDWARPSIQLTLTARLAARTQPTSRKRLTRRPGGFLPIPCRHDLWGAAAWLVRRAQKRWISGSRSYRAAVWGRGEQEAASVSLTGRTDSQWRETWVSARLLASYAARRRGRRERAIGVLAGAPRCDRTRSGRSSARSSKAVRTTA